MHPPEVRAEALALVEAGLNDCEISRRLGIPRRDHPRLAPSDLRSAAQDPAGDLPALLAGRQADVVHLRGLRRVARPLSGRWLHLETEPEPSDYESLSMRSTRRSSNGAIRALLRRCFPENPVGQSTAPTSAWSDGRHARDPVGVLARTCGCLFPQHGPGRKHERDDRLEAWQYEAPRGRALAVPARVHPVGRLRVHQPNTVAVRVPELRLHQPVQGHRRPVHDACDRVGVPTTSLPAPRGRWDVRINRRASVALMLEHVGLKR